MNLYELTTDIQDLYTKLVESADDNGEVDGILAQELAVKEEQFNDKALSIGYLSRKIDDETALIDKEIERLKTLKERRTKAKERILKALSSACEQLGKDKINGTMANISFRESERLEVDDESKIPDEYIRVTVKKEPDKTAIKKAIKDGKEINGVHLQRYKNIQVK